MFVAINVKQISHLSGLLLGYVRKGTCRQGQEPWLRLIWCYQGRVKSQQTLIQREMGPSKLQSHLWPWEKWKSKASQPPGLRGTGVYKHCVCKSACSGDMIFKGAVFTKLGPPRPHRASLFPSGCAPPLGYRNHVLVSSGLLRGPLPEFQLRSLVSPKSMQTTSFPYKNVLTLDPLQLLQSRCMQTMVLPYWCADFKHFNVSPLLLLIIPSYLSSSLLILFSTKSGFFTWPFLNHVLILIIISLICEMSAWIFPAHARPFLVIWYRAHLSFRWFKCI